MKVLVLLAAAAATTLPMTVSAQTEGRRPAPQVRYESVDTPDQMRTGGIQNPDETVCRMITNTGSRLGGRRVCRTRAEWARIAADARETADQSSRNGLIQRERG